ncbi:unnamed protein product, partial [Staurois parvus]
MSCQSAPGMCEVEDLRYSFLSGRPSGKGAQDKHNQISHSSL